jgi:Endosomal/lysosomal potassium channel TMEM175
MSSDADASSHPDDGLRVNRLLTLSDGVIAIALTLLVLQLRVPSLSHAASGRTDQRGGGTGRDGPIDRAVVVEHQRRHVLLNTDGGGTAGHRPVVSPPYFR